MTWLSRGGCEPTGQPSRCDSSEEVPLLHVHRSTRGSALVEALGDLLEQPPDDPFAADVVAVPARGIERWLAQRLSHHLGAGRDGDGVCARVEFPHPDELLDAALASASPEHAAAVDVWHPDRLVWPLLEVLDACPPDEQWCAALRHHLAQGGEELSTRRLAVARRLTGLYAAAAQSRPELLQRWAGNVDDDVPPDLRWQPELWRRLRERVGVANPAELLDRACAALRDDPGEAVPQRISLYGVSRLDSARLRVLAALAQQRDVHLWLHHASPALWQALQDAPPVPHRRAAPQPARHPLLGSLSRDLRELQLRLQQVAPDLQVHSHDPEPVEPATLLQRLQADLRDDRVPTSRLTLRDDDRSVQVHSCHGRARQVDVLREVVLGLMADDPTLEPRDVLVMCPDVEAFAPLVAAAFGDEAHPAGRLRVALADRSPRQTNPLLAVAASLLELGSSRVTASQLLDLAGSPPVRQRFGFDDDDVEQLRAWVAGSGVRWGLDAQHRSGWGLDHVEQGTWRQGLQRLLVGVAAEEGDALVGGVLPYDDLDSSDIELAGRVAELVDRLATALSELSGCHPVGHWLAALERAVETLADVPPDSAWQLAQLRRELDEVRQASAGSPVELCHSDIVALLERRLAGRPTSTSFRTGGLTVCTLTPMRSVPHRVVCLLGLDDGAFPRSSVVDGDDVLARDPHLGERDPRSEDRQLLLDALCAAGDHLVVTYGGSDPRTGAPVPPAVPLGELLDALDLTAQTATGRPAREAVVVTHPLQPFDASNFRPGELGRPAPLSFDPTAYEGALAAAGQRLDPPPFLPQPLPVPKIDEEVVELARLVEFWQHPAKAFLRQRLDVLTSTRDEEPDDALPVELGHLEEWKVGDRLLTRLLDGADLADLEVLEAARGELPPAPLHARLLDRLSPRAQTLLTACQPYLGSPPETVDVEVALRPRRRLLGQVGGVRGDVVLTTTYSKIGPKAQLKAWLELLALTLAQPDVERRAVLLGRDPGKGKADEAATWTAGPVTVSDARAALVQLARLRELGLRTPLPLPLKTGEGFARRGTAGGRSAWATHFSYDGEDREVENVLCWGEGCTFEQLSDWEAPPELGHPGLDFRSLCHAVWRPLQQAENKVESTTKSKTASGAGA